MSDQLITILGVLGGGVIGIVGTVIGIFLNNRYAREQENTRRKRQAIEDAYRILIETDNLIEAFGYDITKDISLRSNIERIKEVRKSSDRVKVLVSIHLPTLKSTLTEYLYALAAFWNAIGAFYHPVREGISAKENQQRENLETAQSKYQSKLRSFQDELEKLVE